MTIYVTEPKKTKGMCKPQAVLHPYSGALLLNWLVDLHPEAIYFSDDPVADGLDPFDPEDYRVTSVSVYSGPVFTLTHRPSGDVLIGTEDVSLETLNWLAQQHHAGVKNPVRSR